MCEYCSKLFKAVEKHDPSQCAVAAALWCHTCKKYGHSTLKCTQTSITRKPQYLEQLLPASVRDMYKIPYNQMTPLDVSSIQPKEPAYQPVIEIPEEKEGGVYTGNIRATLASYNLPPSSVKENKRLLESFGALIGKRVIYLKKPKV
jgi:hypothetical protein